MPAAGGNFLAFWMRFCIKNTFLSAIWRHFLHKTPSQILKIFRLRRAENFMNPGFSKFSKRSVFQFSKCCETRGFLAKEEGGFSLELVLITVLQTIGILFDENSRMLT